MSTAVHQIVPSGFQLAGPIQELVELLKPYEQRVELSTLARILGSVAVTVDDVRAYLRFDEHRYARNLIFRCPSYELLCLCWRSGQRSPIHDHVGSSCTVRIISGVLTNTDFARVSAGYIKATGSHDLACGSISALQDDDIHQVSNLQPPGNDLVTLHVYSPPLVKMNVYSLTDTQPHFEPAPVFTGLHGDGI